MKYKDVHCQQSGIDSDNLKQNAAKRNSFKKYFSDPVFKKHKVSILYPNY
jgi:hypothetical protein